MVTPLTYCGSFRAVCGESSLLNTRIMAFTKADALVYAPSSRIMTFTKADALVYVPSSR
jgi:chaperone required for assembly of F1-ATPase